MKQVSPGWVAAAIVIAVYFVCLLPYGAAPLISHPDERHYAYAALRMVETGDWIIPQTPGGEIRLKKPILPYWFAVAGFKTFGVGIAGFRLFWILAACGVLGLTYALARVLGAGEKHALFATLLTAGNPLFFRAAVQSIPDMPLTFFMMMAAVGFAQILASRNGPPGHAGWVAWIGIALAVLTKGVLPLVFAGFAIVFTAVFARDRLKAMISPLPLLASAALISGWFYYAYRAHPVEFAVQFFGDQVTDKTRLSALVFARQIGSYAAAAVVMLFFLPAVLTIMWWRSPRRASFRSWRPEVKMLTAWSVAVIVMFSFGPFVAPRYLLPVLPVLAVLTALGFSRVDPRSVVLIRTAAWLLAIVGLALAAVLTVGAAIEFQLAPLWKALLFTILAAALVVWIVNEVRVQKRAPLVLPFAIILVIGLSFVPVASLMLPTVAEPVAEWIKTQPVGPQPQILVNQDAEMYVRLLTGQSQPYSRIFEPSASCVAAATDDIQFAQVLQQRGATLKAVQGGYDQRLKGFFEALIGGRLADARRENASTVYFSSCPSTAPAASQLSSRGMIRAPLPGKRGT